MKKRGVRKSSAKAKKVISKSFNNTRAYVALGIAVFLVFVLALGFVNVSQTGNAVNVNGDNNVVFVCGDGRCTSGESSSNCPSDCGTAYSRSSGSSSDVFSGFFDKWNQGTLDATFAKYFFWIILTILIFSALNFAKFPDSTFVQWIIALPVGFFVTAYITPSEIFAILTTYTALGLTLSAIIPFIILLFFSSMLLSNEKIRHMTVGRVILQFALWFLFIGFLFYKIITGYGDNKLSEGVLWVMGIVLALSVLIVIFNKWFRKWIRKMGLEVKTAKAEAESTERSLERQAGHQADQTS